VLVADQTPEAGAADSPLVAGVVRVLRARGVAVEILHHPSGAGVAENRQFLLESSRAPYVLYLDDDIVLEPESTPRLLAAMSTLRTGLVAMAMTGLSYLDDRRPRDWEHFEALGDGERPAPERIRKGSPAWERWRLHNAATPTHLAERLGLSRTSSEWVAYRIAWAAGCVLFDRAALLDAGGFDFWREVPENAHGEDVLVQQRVMARRGGAGILPSGAYHQESETTLPDRGASAFDLRPV
jgi:glycosyltransferase involved in cell wall biosynthesis